MTPPRPVARAWDESGRDVTELVSQQDGRYLATFARGEYQGIAADHFVEVDLGREIPRDSARCGWSPTAGSIRPTAASTSRSARARASSRAGCRSKRRTRPADGSWSRRISGFPAGKNKTILIDLGQVAARRRRARAAAAAADQPRGLLGLAGGRRGDRASRRSTTSRLQPDARRAALSRLFEDRLLEPRGCRRFRDYDTHRQRRRQRWRDLVGYYTRFGDVRELLERVDDRYVIMNAGDELRLSFPAPAPPRSGLDARFRADRRRLGQGRRLQHDASRRPCCRCRRTIGRTTRRLPDGRARGRSGLSPSSGGLADVPHAVRDARWLPARVEMSRSTGRRQRVDSGCCGSCGRRCWRRRWSR